jgi:hypothetical protein
MCFELVSGSARGVKAIATGLLFIECFQWHYFSLPDGTVKCVYFAGLLLVPFFHGLVSLLFHYPYVTLALLFPLPLFSLPVLVLFFLYNIFGLFDR